MSKLLQDIEARAAKGLAYGSDMATSKDVCLADILTLVRSGDLSSSDITIAWGNKPTYNRHKVAIDVQDAGNLRALAREFVKVVDAAMEENKSTEATWADPAVVMFVNKFESLCHSEQRFSDAYAACRAKAPLDKLDHAAKARALWAMFDKNERAASRIGMFPAEKMQDAEHEGYKAKDLAVALMDCAKRDGGMIA